MQKLNRSTRSTILVALSAIALSLTLFAADTTPTNKNLQTSFAGESQAYQKYTAFAKKAEEEKFPQVAKLFRAAAQAEALHAAKQLQLMGGVKTTADNLQTAISGENYEQTKMYPEFAAQATKDKNDVASMTFNGTAAVEKGHETLYQKALTTVKTGKDLPAQQIYFCSVCGQVEIGAAPDACPVCTAPKSAFIEIK